MGQEPRVRRRVPCAITVGERRHSGMVLNVSPRGLFVQTSADAAPGTPVAINLNAPTHREAIALQAQVVWKRRVPARLVTIAQGGVGLRIHTATEAYYEFLASVMPAGESRETSKPSSPASSAAKAAPATGNTAPPAPRYRVRVSQLAGPRSRTLVVDGDSHEEARRTALAQVGQGWKVLDIERS